MDNLRQMLVFFHVVDRQSFSGAAKHLGIAKSAVSRHISLLEKNIGARLLNRTTRSLSLTEAGEIYFKSCARIAAEAELATLQVSRLQDEPVGTLRVAGPISFGNQVLATLANEFMQLHPALNIELMLDEHFIDMVKENFDVSFRIGWMPDSNLVARKLGDWPVLLCASPEYLDRYGRPETPAQLIEHECLIYTLIPTPHHLIFRKNNREERIQIKGRFKTNSADTIRTLLLQGAGIAPATKFLIGSDIKSGRLEQLLADYDCGSAGIYAVYQDRHYQKAKVRLFVDYMDSRLKQLIE